MLGAVQGDRMIVVLGGSGAACDLISAVDDGRQVRHAASVLVP